ADETVRLRIAEEITRSFGENNLPVSKQQIARDIERVVVLQEMAARQQREWELLLPERVIDTVPRRAIERLAGTMGVDAGDHRHGGQAGPIHQAPDIGHNLSTVGDRHGPSRKQEITLRI